VPHAQLCSGVTPVSAYVIHCDIHFECPCPHVAFSSSPKDAIQVTSGHSNDVILTRSQLQRPYVQIRSHSWVPEVRTSTYLLEGHHSTLDPSPTWPRLVWCGLPRATPSHTSLLPHLPSPKCLMPALVLPGALSLCPCLPLMLSWNAPISLASLIRNDWAQVGGFQISDFFQIFVKTLSV
jgi:hypothetical protein